MGTPAPSPAQPYNPYNQPPMYPGNQDFQPQRQNVYGEYPVPPAYSSGPPSDGPYNTSNVSMTQNQYSIIGQPVVQDMAFQYGQQVRRIHSNCHIDIINPEF